jgi:hypothetical protein
MDADNTKRFDAELERIRSTLTDVIHSISELAAARHPQAGPELTLAQRHAEDCRMRLGTALVKQHGGDPFANHLDPSTIDKQQ